MKPGALVIPNSPFFFLELERDSYDDGNHGVPWEGQEVGIVVEIMKSGRYSGWAKVLVPKGTGYCLLEELTEIKWRTKVN